MTMNYQLELPIDDNNKPICYFLIGLPCSGKSTYVSKNFANIPVASSDKHIEYVAMSRGKTYSEVFKSYVNEAQEEMYEEISRFTRNRTSFVWDQTNLTVKSRKAKITPLLQAGFNVHAYYFNVTLETMMDRNAIRAYEGKMIPESVLLNMASIAKWPSYDEGFTKLNFI